MISLKRLSHRVAIAVLLALTVLIWHAETIAGQLTESWVNNTASATGISIERSIGSTGTFTEIATTGPAATAYTDLALSDGTSYCYRVRAYNQSSYSDYSNTACRTTAQALTLSVAPTGTGSGVVISTQAGILCGTTCSATYGSGTAVTLTATPATGSTFAGWGGGGCTGTGACMVTVTAPTTVTATFTASPVGLTVTTAGTGSGTVSSSPAGITCGTTCSATYSPGTALTLTAAAATGSTFTGWSGACTGTGSCGMTLTSGTNVTATFSQQPQPQPQPQTQYQTLTVGVSGKGSVTSSLAGINCGGTCSANYPAGTSVVLTANPGPGAPFVFLGWDGVCAAAGTGSCTVTMTTALTVNANFGKKR